MKDKRKCSPDTKKRCSKCKKMKYVSEFYYNPRGVHECFTECKECLKEAREKKNKAELKMYIDVLVEAFRKGKITGE